MIYFIRCQLTKHVKIGYTEQREFAKRLKEIQTGSPGELLIVGAMAGGLTEERVLHGKYADKHVRGEWFALTDDDIAAAGLVHEGWVQAGRENDAWESARFKDSAIRNEHTGRGMKADIERWDRSFLDDMPPKERREYVVAMLARARGLKRRKRGRANLTEPFEP